MRELRFIDEADTFGYPLEQVKIDNESLLLRYGDHAPIIMFGPEEVVVGLPPVHCGSELALVIKALPGATICTTEPLKGYTIAIWPHNLETLICLTTGMMVYGEQYPGEWEDMKDPLYNPNVH